ncbi:MAG: methyl-accepting chemotaxis protein [Dongiaceae bacterium]
MISRGTYQKAFDAATTVCQRGAMGDFEARITDIEAFGELGVMLNAINDLLDLADAYVRESAASLEAASQRKYHREFLLRGMHGDFRRGAQAINVAREVMKRRQDLTDDFQSTVSSVVGVVSEAAGELEQTAKGVAGDAVTAHTQSAAAAAASEETAATAQAVAASSEELSASIGEIGRQAQDAMRASQTAAEEMHVAIESVRSLNDAAQKVDKVVTFIHTVAGQTNMLALNATIEAARAGQAGRGFAVVASEVKALATQVSNATKDITAQMTAMQEASKHTEAAIATIDRRMQGVREMAAAIAAAVEEQSAATAEITANVEQAAKGSSEVSRNIAGITVSASQTGSAAKDMLASTQRLSHEADTLNSKVRTFLEQMHAT